MHAIEWTQYQQHHSQSPLRANFYLLCGWSRKRKKKATWEETWPIHTKSCSCVISMDCAHFMSLTLWLWNEANSSNFSRLLLALAHILKLTFDDNSFHLVRFNASVNVKEVKYVWNWSVHYGDTKSFKNLEIFCWSENQFFISDVILPPWGFFLLNLIWAVLKMMTKNMFNRFLDFLIF